MEALQKLENLNSVTNWRFHYYGPHGEYVEQAADRAGIRDRVVSHGTVAHHVVLSALRGANCAVVITSVDDSVTPAKSGVITGKIFEALGLRVPILVIAPHGSDVESIVRVTGCGSVFSASETEGMAHFLACRPVNQRADDLWRE